eukprot:TRINITY_DN3473_c0_g1_i3.p1 TRINITY_DN3473_c0_g1~~TRINITY_DN3473_c0_g1_i3.p1  ORF type:complete len:687 (+),score=47.61 TRINITY_DN3473_c0_g1_i3:187-2061(+)
MSNSTAQTISDCSPTDTEIQQLWFVLDSAWLLITTFFILVVPLGYTLMEHGFSRPQSQDSYVGSKLILNLISGLLAWWSFGYAFAYSDGDGSFVIGSRGFFQSEWSPQEWQECDAGQSVLDSRFIDSQSLPIYWQQWAVAQIVGVMVCSAMSERLHSFGSIVNSVIMTGFVTPVSIRWVWSAIGFLSTYYNEDLVRRLYENKYGDVWDTAIAEGAMDHAGAAVIHILAGAAALVAIACVGRRTRFFEDEDSDVSYSKGDRGVPSELLDATGHIGMESCTLGAVGGFLIWLGLLAVESSMLFGVSENRIWAVSNAVINAGLASAGSAGMCVITFLVVKWGRKRIPTKLIVNSALTGVVAAASGGIVMEGYGAVATGAVAGLFYMLLAWALRQLQVDDPLEIVSVNLMGGWWGMIASGLLATDWFTQQHFQSSTYGLFYGGGGKLLLVNVITASILTGWGCFISAVINLPLRFLKLLRLSEEYQKEMVRGNDSSKSLPAKPYPAASMELPAQLPDHLPYQSQNMASYQSVNTVVNRGMTNFQGQRSSPLPQHPLPRSPSPRLGGRPSTPPYSRPRTPDSQGIPNEITLNPHSTRSASAAAMLPPQRSLRGTSNQYAPSPIQDNSRY